jgi:two-component system chemotaxis sensor kinase CheA
MAGSPGEVHSSDTAKGEEEERTYRIRFVPDEDIFLSGTNPILLLKELRELGDCTIIPFLKNIDGLEGCNPEKCYCSWDIIITTSAGLNALKDIFIFIESESLVQIDLVDSFSDMIGEESTKRLGEILVDRGVIEEETLRKALGDQKRLGEVLVETNLVSRSEVDSALREQQHGKRLQEKRMESQGAGSTIRVASGKLDSLVDLVGELVTVQARIGRISTEDATGQLRQVSELLERLVDELRDNTMSLRMVPIGIAFSKFRRLVRDLSHELGKNVEMAAEGAETELDKTVIEQLGDPLVHLIRNSIDHGIEMPEVRKARGKPGKGTVLLSARHVGASVQIAIKDDGAGLDREEIYSKAVKQGLLSPSADLSDEEVFQIIFQPGFSTAKSVTSVSGRGVGMDVVKRQIEALRGSVSIWSRKGEGSTITITLPLTLAIVDGLLVRVGTDFFVVPLSSVEACVELNEADHITGGNRRLIEYREKLLPYVRIDTLFSLPSDENNLRQVVVAELDQNRFGIVVDEVIGDHQTVIKSLGPLYRNVTGISGATILGDGRVALILDIMQLAGISARVASRN